MVGAGEDGGAVTNSEAQVLVALTNYPDVLRALCRGGDLPQLVLAAVPAVKDEPRAVTHAAVPRDGLLRVEDVVRVVDHADPPEAVGQILAFGPQDRLVQIPRVELYGTDL